MMKRKIQIPQDVNKKINCIDDFVIEPSNYTSHVTCTELFEKIYVSLSDMDKRLELFFMHQDILYCDSVMFIIIHLFSM